MCCVVLRMRAFEQRTGRCSGVTLYIFLPMAARRGRLEMTRVSSRRRAGFAFRRSEALAGTRRPLSRARENSRRFCPGSRTANQATRGLLFMGRSCPEAPPQNKARMLSGGLPLVPVAEAPVFKSRPSPMRIEPLLSANGGADREGGAFERPPLPAS